MVLSIFADFPSFVHSTIFADLVLVNLLISTSGPLADSDSVGRSLSWLFLTVCQIADSACFVGPSMTNLSRSNETFFADFLRLDRVGEYRVFIEDYITTSDQFPVL